MSITEPTPAARWDLNERARFDFEGVEWVAYDDGAYIDVIDAADFDAETYELDYSEWCHGNQAAPAVVYLAAAEQMGIEFTSGAGFTVKLDDDGNFVIA